jgi:hypothetical protein
MTRKEKQLTTYVVLRAMPATEEQHLPLHVRLHLNSSWEVVGTQDADSRVDAIRDFAGDGEDTQEGVYRAVPESSWKGYVTVERVTKTQRTITGEAEQ